MPGPHWAVEHAAGAGLQASLSVSAQDLLWTSSKDQATESISFSGDPRRFSVLSDSFLAICTEQPSELRKVSSVWGLLTLGGWLALVSLTIKHSSSEEIFFRVLSSVQVEGARLEALDDILAE